MLRSMIPWKRAKIPIPPPKREGYFAEATAVFCRCSSRELEVEKDESGRWRIPQRVVHELLPSRPPRKGTANGAFKARQEALEVSESPVETQLRMEPPEGARALGGLPRAYGGCREHLEGESLERERERADVERERAEALKLEVELLREQLAEASTSPRPSKNSPGTALMDDRRSWWRRFFGFR